MSDLLKESIADAKAVRETALANAKTFLEENFAASMKEMFAEKLKEEMAEESVQEELGSSGIGKGEAKPAADASKTSTNTSGHETQVVEEGGEEITSAELDEILAELESEAGEEKGEEKEKEEEKCEEAVESDVSEDVNLDELLAELEADEAAPAVPVEAPTPAPAPVQAVAPEQVPAPAPEQAPAAGQVPSPSEGEESDDVTSEEMAEALVALNEENESLKSQLADHVQTVKYLKGVLSETNLLNAKLLYTNKLFKGKNLTEEQKLKVIGTFDLTKNIREVKLAYTVLAESFNAGASVAKKKTNATAQTITEGLASKPVPSTKPESTIVDPQASDLASRLQKLAGIKK